jgi:hypothetical protein
VKRIAFAVLIQLALLAVILPAAAEAKNVRSATICGTSGCLDVTGRDLSADLIEGGTEVSPPSHKTPWFRLNATVGGGGGQGTLVLAVLPRLGLIRGCCSMTGGYNWIRLTHDGKRAYIRLTRDVRPFPAQTLRVVTRGEARDARLSRSRPDPPATAQSGAGVGFPAWGWISIGIGCLIALGVLGLIRRRGTS